MTSFISWMDNIRNFLKPVYLFLYRGSAFLVITGGLLFLLGWGFVILFFLFNHSWVSPTYVSLTSKEALTFAAGYQTAQQNYYTLMVTHNQAVREFQIAKTTHENMVDLGQVSLDYNRTLKSAAKVKGPQIAENVEVSKHFDQVKQQLYRDRLLGLITSTDLVSGLASVQQFQTNTVNDGVAWATTNLTTLTGEVQLTAQSMQSASDVATKRDIIIASELSVSTAKQVLDAFNESIYKKAFEVVE